MKKYYSSSSRNEEWPGARRNWLRWTAALTVGLAVAAGVSIPLEEKSNKSSEGNSLTSNAGNPIFEDPHLEDDTRHPIPQTPPTTASSEEIQRKWDIGILSQEPTFESSNLPEEPQSVARRVNATPAQGSEDSSVGYRTIRTSPQQVMLEIPQAPAIGRIPPVRPSPTPVPTPPPIRSPQ